MKSIAFVSDSKINIIAQIP